MSKFVFILDNGLPVSIVAQDRDVAVYRLQRMGFRVR